MKTVLLALLRAYQLGISPFLGQNCRFYPSCSQYAAEAIREHGALKGGALATGRLCKCHPWHPGGFDPVPKKTTEHSAPTSRDGGPLAGRAAHDSSRYSPDS